MEKGIASITVRDRIGLNSLEISYPCSQSRLMVRIVRNFIRAICYRFVFANFLQHIYKPGFQQHSGSFIKIGTMLRV